MQVPIVPTAAVSVVLVGRENWPEWTAALKTRALLADAWDYFNPDTEAPEPKAPDPQQARNSIQKRNDAFYQNDLEHWEALPAEEKLAASKPV